MTSDRPPPPRSANSVVGSLLWGSWASPARVAAIYLAFSLLWIWVSDWVLIAFGVTGELNFLAAALKGTVFVSLSTGLVYLSARREARVKAESARLLEAVVNGTTDAVFVKDSAGKYLLFNEGAARLVGRPTAEVLGKDDSFLFDPEGAERVMARDRRILSSGQTETEEEVLTADGVTRTYLATKFPYRDDRGAVVGLVGISHDITDRKRAESALQQERDRFEKILETAPVVIHAFQKRADGTWCFPYVSRRIEEVYGVPAERLAEDASPVFAMIHPADADPVRELIERSARDLTNWEAVFRILHPARGIRWVEGRSVPARQPDGSTVWLGYIADVTDRRRTEEAVRESEGRLKLALSAGRLAVWEWDVKTDAVFWSAEVYPIMGVEANRFDGSLAAFERLVHPDDRDELWAKVTASLAAGGPPFDHEFRCVRPDGSSRWLMNQGRVSRDADGRAARLTGVVSDITDRKLAEESRARLAAIVESSDDAILSKSLDGVIRSWNRGAERLFGYSEAEAVGKPITILFPPELESEEDTILSGILKGERVEHFDTVRVTKDGRRVNVSLTISPIRDTAGGIIAASKVVRSIDDRVRARQRLAVQHAVASTLAESDHLREATPAILRTVCETLGWAAGGLWMLDRGRTRLAPVEVWGAGESLAAFLTASRQLTLTPGVGLPGRVWEAGTGVWMADVTAEPVFVRHREAALAGLRGAFGFPIRGGGEVIGVVEFFHTQTAPPDDELLRVFEVLGNQIGHFVDRNRSRAALHESEGRLRLFVEHAPAALAMFDRDMRYMTASRRWVSDYRLPEADLVGRSHYDLFPDLPAEWRAVHTRALAGEVLRAERDSFTRADGTTQWMRWEVRPWYSSAGAVGGIVMFADDITASVVGETALRENEERFRRLVDSIMDGVISVDADQRVTLFNPAAEKMFGLPAAEVLGWPLDRLIPAPHRTSHASYVAGFMRTGVTNRSMAALGAVSAVRGDGTEFPIEASISQIEVNGQKVATAIVRDISARVRAEAAVRESEERFRNLVEFLPDAIFLNVGGRVSFCNPACVRLFGASEPAQVVGKFALDLFHPDDHEAIRRRIVHMEATGEGVPPLDERAVRLDGAITSVSVTASPMRDAGRPAILVVLRDLTEQRRLESQLRHQELMIREAGELAHVGGWGFDPATGVGDWTAETARIHGVAPAASTTIADGLRFFAGGDRARIEAAVAAAVAHGTPYDLELQLTAADGGRKWVRTICRPIVDNGRVVRVRGSLQDITDRKRAEEEIRELNAGLEARVRERTAELQAVNHELESFSYSVSHDLRAPIRHIAAFAGLVRETAADRLPLDSREHLDQVVNAARRMGLLVDDLLRFSRLGRQPVRRQPVDTRRLVDECLGEALSAADRRRFDIRVGDLPDCVGDAPLLRQVWVNLLANAVKYSASRERTVIEVGVEDTTSGPAYYVRDNGVGFDMKYAHKLFGVFQRLHRAEEFDGTGIGLALVQRIVHRHDGRVWANSAPGQGATFYFTLGTPGDRSVTDTEQK